MPSQVVIYIPTSTFKQNTCSILSRLWLWFVLDIYKTFIWHIIIWVTPGPLCRPGLRSSALIPTRTNGNLCVVQRTGTEPCVCFWLCPLAQCRTQTVLPNLACVTLSLWHGPHAGMPLHPPWQKVCVCVCVRVHLRSRHFLVKHFDKWNDNIAPVGNEKRAYYLADIVN